MTVSPYFDIATASLSLVEYLAGALAKKGRRPPQDASNDPVKDRCQTPPNGTRTILPFLPPNCTIWESAAGEGYMVRELMAHGYDVIASDVSSGQDYFSWEPDMYWDGEVTNVPFSKKYPWLRKACERSIRRGSWFALLVPDKTIFSQKYIDIEKEFGPFEIVQLKERIPFKMPLWNSWYDPNTGKLGSSQFNVVWITRGLSIGKDRTIVEVEDLERYPD